MIKCPNCGTLNSEQGKFCKGCGAALPEYGTPENRNPEYGTPENRNPEYRSPENRNPEYGEADRRARARRNRRRKEREAESERRVLLTVLGVQILILIGLGAFFLFGSKILKQNSGSTAEEAFEASTEEAGTRTLIGYVKDSETGEPLANAYVRIEIDGVNHGFVTDEKGAYEIEDLPAGSYTLFAKAEGHHTSAVYGFEITAGKKAQLQDILLTPAPEDVETETEEMPWDY